MGTSSAFSGPAPNVFLKIYWAAFPSRKILLGRTSRFPGHLLGRPSVPSRRPRPYLGLIFDKDAEKAREDVKEICFEDRKVCHWNKNKMQWV